MDTEARCENCGQALGSFANALGYWNSTLVLESLYSTVTAGPAEIEEKSQCVIQKLMCVCGLLIGRIYVSTTGDMDELAEKCLLDISAIRELAELTSRENLVRIPVLVEDCIETLKDWNKDRAPLQAPPLSIPRPKSYPTNPPSTSHREIIEID